MSYSIDAHLLIHASDTSSPEHRAACDFLIGRAAAPDLLCLIWATLMAYLVPDAHIATEVCQSPRHFQDPVMRAGGEVHFLHRVFEIAITFGAELAVLADLARAHGGIRGVGRFLEPI